MNEIKITKEKAAKAYKEGSLEIKKAILNLVGKENLNLNIIDSVKTIEDIFEIKPPTEDQKLLINYQGSDSKMLGAKALLLAETIAEVFNEDTVLDWDNQSQKKWFGWYDYSSTCSGFAFSYCTYWLSRSFVPSRLHFKSEELFWYAVKTFPEIYKTLMIKK